MHRGAPCTAVHHHLCAPAPWCITVVGAPGCTLHRVHRMCEAPASRCFDVRLRQGAWCCTSCDPASRPASGAPLGLFLSPRSGGRRTFSPGVGWVCASTLSCLSRQLILSHISIRITCPVLPPERAQAICRRHLPRGGVERLAIDYLYPTDQCKPKAL